MRKIIVFFMAAMLVSLLLVDAAPSRAAGSYMVRTGDTLFSIAARFNVSISELATINRVYDVNAIYVGQILLLPNALPPGYYTTYPIYTPPPVYTIPPPPTARYVWYTVRAGDFLAAIAVHYGVTSAAILAVNTIPDPNILYIGQTIVIPFSPMSAPPPINHYFGNLYTVQPGDTLYAIGARFNRDIYNIARVNGLLDLNAIYAGTVLLIP